MLRSNRRRTPGVLASVAIACIPAASNPPAIRSFFSANYPSLIPAFRSIPVYRCSPATATRRSPDANSRVSVCKLIGRYQQPARRSYFSLSSSIFLPESLTPLSKKSSPASSWRFSSRCAKVHAYFNAVMLPASQKHPRKCGRAPHHGALCQLSVGSFYCGFTARKAPRDCSEVHPGWGFQPVFSGKPASSLE